MALAAELEARGHSVLCAPVIEIVMRPDAVPDLAGVKGLAFTSANGVRAFQPFAPAVRHFPAYAVGPQTAAALGAAGFSNVHIADGDVASLAGTIAADGPQGPVLHISGRNQAGDLAAALQAAGCAARRAVLYEARAAENLPPNVLAALRDKALDGVLLYSKRSAEIFYRLAGNANGTQAFRKAFLPVGGSEILPARQEHKPTWQNFPMTHIYACLTIGDPYSNCAQTGNHTNIKIWQHPERLRMATKPLMGRDHAWRPTPLFQNSAGD